MAGQRKFSRVSPKAKGKREKEIEQNPMSEQSRGLSCQEMCPVQNVRLAKRLMWTEDNWIILVSFIT